MSDLINGRDMLKRYQEDLCYGIACKDCSMCTEDGGCRVEEWIDNFPSADRPQGEWIEVTNGRGGHECSNCHAYAPSYMNGDEHLSDYCPNCGARMLAKDTNVPNKKGADDENQ